MSHIQIEDINYVIKGETENLINLNIKKDNNKIDNVTFITDTGNEVANISSITMTHRIIKTKDSINTNITSLGPVDVIYALFDFKDVASKSSILKSDIETVNIRSETGELNTDKFIDIYAPHLSSNPIEFCQGIFIGESGTTNLISFGLSKSTNKSPLIKGTNLTDTYTERMENKNNSLYWNYKIIESGNKTYLGVPLSVLEKNHTFDAPLSSYYPVSSYFDYLSSFGNLSSDVLSNLFDPANNLKDIERNYIYQLTLLDNRQLFNNHNNGDILCDFIIGKNPYDAQYSMKMNSLDEISNVREYTGLGVVGGRVFLKYKDNIKYVKDSKSNSVSENINNVEMTKKVLSDNFNNYQKIEYLDSISQFKSSSYHKSNLYSIKIKGLFDNISEDSYVGQHLNKIKSDITRSIRKIAEELSPAHTQLFDIIYLNNKNGIVDSNTISLIDNVVFIFEDEETKTHILGLTEFGKKVENLTITSTVLSIENGALNQSRNVYMIEINNNPNFSILEKKALIQNDTLISYPTNDNEYKFIVPETISNIYSSAFYNCQHLLKVEIPLSVKVNSSKYDSKDNPLFVKNNYPIVNTYYSYTVNFDKGNSTDFQSNMPSQLFYSNQDSQLNANTYIKTGYIFDKWWNSETDEYFEDKQYNYINQFKDDYGSVTLTATWEPITYFIRFSPEINKIDIDIADGYMNDITANYNIPTNLGICEFSKIGYTFNNWQLYSENSPNYISTFNENSDVSNLTTINNDIVTLYPSFNPNTYFIEFLNTNSSITATLPQTLTCKYDEYWNLRSGAGIFGNTDSFTKKSQYYVKAWRGNISSVDNLKTIYAEMPINNIDDVSNYSLYKNIATINEEIVKLSAVWAGLYYVHFDNGSSGISSNHEISGTMDDQLFIINDNNRVSLFENKFEIIGYDFDGWKFNNRTYIDKQKVRNLSKTAGDTITLIAQWEKIYYIIFDKNSGDGDNMKYVSIKANRTYELPKCTYTKTGYEFKGWSYFKVDNKDSNVESSEIPLYLNNNTIYFKLSSSDIEKFKNEGIITDDGKITLYAVWEPNTYYINFNKNFE